MGSWWKRTVVLLISLLLLAGLFFGWTSINFSRQLRATIIQENAKSAQLWANLVESRTGTVYEHIYELLLTLYNNTMLRDDTPIMSAQTKLKIVEMMDDKLLISDYADAFFVFDTHNDFYLFAAKQSLAGTDVLDLKSFAYENAQDLAKPFGDKTWNIDEINQRLYFTKSVRLGKYVAGAISSCDYYRIENNFSVLGRNISCRLQIEDTFYEIGEHQDYPARLKEGYHNGIVTVTAPVPQLNALAVVAADAGSMSDKSNGTSVLLVIDSGLCLVLVMILLLLLRRDVAKPTKALIHANQTLASGDTAYRLPADQAGSREFQALYHSFNDMASQIVSLRIEAYDMKLQEEQNRLTMLRAQLRPHSFLNAVTTISNMTYINKPEEIRAYIAAFAKFMRYMLRVNAPWTTVGDELDHIRNYLKMQDTRFPGSIRSTISCEDSVKNARIPLLLLFTLVENSIKHAMTLYEPMDIHLRCERIQSDTFRGIRLVEEDSGRGFPPEVIPQLLSDDPNSIFAKEHLGLSNVRYTLNLVYGRSDLLHISNRECGGAHVEIRIPEEEEKENEASDL